MDCARLPKELLRTIFCFLTCKDLAAIVFVNSSWHSITRDESVWKEALFNSCIPHPYSYDQKSLSWRQIVKRHLETKKNIAAKRCVQFVLGTRGAINQRSDILLRETTVSGKHCLMIWDTVQMHGGSFESAEYYSTELWDLDTRTIIQTYPDLTNVTLFNDYLVAGVTPSNNCIEYSKFDPTQKQVGFTEKIGPTHIGQSYVSIVYNGDPTSSLIALNWTNWATFQSFVQVYDLRTRTKILEKEFEKGASSVMTQFYGNKFVACDFQDSNRSAIVTEISIENGAVIAKDTKINPLLCMAVAGDDAWVVTSKGNCISRINIKTRACQKYEIKEDLRKPIGIRIMDGLLWFYYHDAKVLVFDVSSPPTCRLLRQITFPARDGVHITQLPNGTFCCLSTTFVYTMSFRDEDIELPIQVLQIEPNGQNEVLDIAQGDLNALVSRHYSDNVSSQIVFEDETQRYCIIFTYHASDVVNDFAETAKSWYIRAECHKRSLFNLVHFDWQDKKALQPARSTAGSLHRVAYGPCWVFLETKVSGAWQKSIPADHWTFFKTKLGLN